MTTSICGNKKQIKFLAEEKMAKESFFSPVILFIFLSLAGIGAFIFVYSKDVEKQTAAALAELLDRVSRSPQDYRRTERCAGYWLQEVFLRCA